MKILPLFFGGLFYLALLLNSFPCLASQNLIGITDRLIGTPFLKDPLGEGQGTYDPDPLARLDAFDCTTFVETVWAMSGKSGLETWREKLTRIRYASGKPGFVNRLHFISVDWNAYQIARGAAIDVTESLAPLLELSITIIDRRKWIQKLHPQQLESFDSSFPKYAPQLAKIRYLGIDSLLKDEKIWRALESAVRADALLVNFVRPNWDTTAVIGTRIDITHQGLLIWNGKSIRLRHASALRKAVADEDFREYLSTIQIHPGLKGLQLLKLLEP